MSKTPKYSCGFRKQSWCIGLLLATLILGLVYPKSYQAQEHLVLEKGLAHCWDIASKTKEPNTLEYRFRPEGVRTDGEVWAQYYWEGNITREQFDDALKRDERSFVQLKIVKNRLYMKQASMDGQSTAKVQRANAVIPMMMIALAMFKVPDSDILLDLDAYQQHADIPSLVMAFRAPGGNFPGFAIPHAEVARRSLGPKQMNAYHNCLDKRYPIGVGRIPKAVWRGKWEIISSTNVQQAQLVKAAAKVPLIADVRFSSYAQECKLDACLQDLIGDKSFVAGKTAQMASEEFPPGSIIDPELLNKYAIVVDVDGHGYSKDLGNFLQANTPILKQEPKYPLYFWPQLVDKGIIPLFAANASDFPRKLQLQFLEFNEDPEMYHRHWIKRLHTFSKNQLTHVGLARAMAYALTVYGNKQDWTPELDSSFSKIDIENYNLPKVPAAFLTLLKKLSR